MESNKDSYRAVLKATTLLGGSSIFRILTEVVRRKLIAVILGPVGVGLFGVFQNIEMLLGSVMELGVRTSGVRQVAAAYGKGDENALASVVKALRQLVFSLAVVGAVLFLLVSGFISVKTFGNDLHTRSLRMLVFALFVNQLIVGQACVIQGCRRVGSLALMSIIGSVNGTVLSVPVLYFWGEAGIVYSMIMVSVASFVTNWFFARQIPISSCRLRVRETIALSVSILKIGIPIMLSGVTSSLAAYIIRMILIRDFGLDGAGYWTAAFTFSGALVSFILGAMSADYYPRLSAVSSNAKEVENVLNVQTEIALLLAVPAMFATCAFAQIGIPLLYDNRFGAAVPILQWSVLGMLGRLVGWPLGYVLLAKGKSGIFFFTELVSSIWYVACIYFCSRCFGLTGTGVAYMLCYLLYVPLMVITIRQLGVRAWNLRIVVILSVGLISLVVCGVISKLDNQFLRYVMSVGILFVLSAFVFLRLKELTGLGLLSVRKRGV